MPIDSLHPQYKARATEMRDCRAAFEGERAIKMAGETYLPRLRDQTNNDYDAYKKRALFFSITSKTVTALVGMAMFRLPIVTNASPRMKPYFEDRQGAEFLEIVSTTLQEVLLQGGYGILIDAPEDGGDPQLVRYPRDNIINWKVDGDGRPTLVVLQETIIVNKGNDEYEQETDTQYRELKLVNGQYTITLWDGTKKQPQRTIVPTLNGLPMDHIPFFFINPLGVSFDQVKSPMLDIVDLNISHYRTSADLEHGRHFTGLPTPVVIGVESGTELYIGSHKAWVLPPDADAKYLEFTGQGLQTLEKALIEKQGQMASMSARMIDNSKRGSEAAETVRLRYMSESAGLTTVVRSVEDAMNQIHGEVADILGEPKPTVQLNKEYMNTKLTADEITAFVNAYIEGTITKDTLIYNFRKGDVISSKMTDEEAAAGIRAPGQGSATKSKPGNTGEE